MTEFGGIGGFNGTRPMNPDDLFEAAVNRCMGDALRAEDDQLRSGFYGKDCLGARLWGSLANIEWEHKADGHEAGYSFRAAGDLIAAIKGRGDYMQWYCSAHYGGDPDSEVVTLLAAEGWTPKEESYPSEQPKKDEP